MAPRRRRGFFASLPFVGIQLGTLLGAGTFALIAMADKAVLQGGWLWRVPFLASFILIAVAIFIRLKLKETPAFQELEKHKNVVKNPIGALWKHSKKNVLLGIGLRMGENGNSSIYSALLVSFMSMPAGVFAGNNSIGPVGLLIAAGFAAVMVVTFGALSDRFGRVPVYRYGALFQAIIAVPAFYLVTLGNVTLVWVVMAVGIAIGVQSMLGRSALSCPNCSDPSTASPASHESRNLGGSGWRTCTAARRADVGRHQPLMAGPGHLLPGPGAHLIRDHILYP